MTTVKQERLLRKLKGQMGLKRYRMIQKELGYDGLTLKALSTAQASRLIGAVLADIEREKADNFHFAMRLYALKVKEPTPRR